MIVGSWPGYVSTQNSFLRIFLDGLSEAGCGIESIDSIAALTVVRDVDVLLLHWPQRVFWEAESRTGAAKNMVDLVRNLRVLPTSTKVVWLAHDLRPHDGRGLQKVLWGPFMSALLRSVDGVLTLSDRTSELVRNEYRLLADRPFRSVRHPAYPGQSLAEDERLSARAELGFEVGDVVVGYCGQLRQSKGLDRLVDSFQRMPGPQYRLLIAGYAPGTAKSLVDRLEQAARNDHRVRLEIEDLSDSRYRRLLGVCDLVVAPFRDYLHSGSLVHALSADRPVLTPRTPFAEGLLSDLGQNWVNLYDGPLTSEILAEVASVTFPSSVCPLEKYRSSRIGAEVLAWLRSEVVNTDSSSSSIGGRP